MTYYRHRSTCSCGWKGPWRLLWIIAWLDYYRLHDRGSKRRWGGDRTPHRPVVGWG